VSRDALGEMLHERASMPSMRQYAILMVAVLLAAGYALVHPDSCAAWAPHMHPTALAVLAAGSDCVATVQPMPQSMLLHVYACMCMCTHDQTLPATSAPETSRRDVLAELLACNAAAFTMILIVVVGSCGSARNFGLLALDHAFAAQHARLPRRELQLQVWTASTSGAAVHHASSCSPAAARVLHAR
jgi:hypothetical protein